MCVGGGCNQKKKLEIKERQMRKKKIYLSHKFHNSGPRIFIVSLFWIVVCVCPRQWVNHKRLGQSCRHGAFAPWLHFFSSLPVCLSVFFLIFLDTDGISLRNI